MNELFTLRNKFKPHGYRDSMYFKTSVNGDVITVEDIDYEENKADYFKNFGNNNEEFQKEYKKTKHLLEVYEDYIEYNIELYCKSKYSQNYQHMYTAHIGCKKNITKDELLNILKSDEEVDNNFDVKDLDNVVFKAIGAHKVAFDNLYGVAKITEETSKMVEQKNNLEYLISQFDNKSSGNYLKKFKNVYNFDRLGLLKKVAEGKFDKMAVYTVPSRRNFVVFGDESIKGYIDNVTSNTELYDLALKNKIILVDTSKFDTKSFAFEDSYCGVSNDEVNKVMLDNLDKQMLVNDYKEFIDYYNLAKIDIKLNLKEIKVETDAKIRSLQAEKKQGEKALNLLEENDEMKL